MPNGRKEVEIIACVFEPSFIGLVHKMIDFPSTMSF